MTRALYYATYTRNLSNLAKYLLYPICLAGFGIKFKDFNKASIAASTVCGVFFAGLTTKFAAEEAATFDSNVMDAVSAEMGIDKKNLKFSDYYDTKNEIVKQEFEDWKKVQFWRYLTDGVMLLPLALSYAKGVLSYKDGIERTEGWQKTIADLIPGEQFLTPWKQYDKGHPKAGQLEEQVVTKNVLRSLALNEGVYGAKSAYWWYETAYLSKTSHYEIVKLRETSEYLGKDVGIDDIYPIIQRAREDKGLRHYTLEEKEVLRPLINEVIERFFKRRKDKEFPVSELVYLIGMDKLNIHDAEGRVSQSEIDKSRIEIEKLATIGLSGIREENKHKREALKAVGKSPKKEISWVEKLQRGVLDIAHDALIRIHGSGPVEFKEELSSRGPDMDFAAGHQR